jgi:putative phosphoesterase
MRILIFADLHGNLEALNALQSAEPRPDALFFLGDAVGYGPDPAACVAWLRHNATWVVQGDHDNAAATGSACASPEEWREIAQATCESARSVLPRASVAYLGALPREQSLTIGRTRFRMTHQGPDGLDALTAPDAAWQSLVDQHSADVLLFGHTHVPLLRRVGKAWIVNPGSLGQPRHGLPSATYAVWDDGDLRIQHIDYDPTATIRKLALMQLDPEHLLHLQRTLARGM